MLGDAVHAYSVRLAGHGGDDPNLAIAIIAPGATGSVARGVAMVRIPGMRGSCTFYSCSSSEGIHLTVRAGDKVVWHEYYYVPYDLEPTCDAEGMEEPDP